MYLFVNGQTPVTETIYSSEWYLPLRSQTPKQILQTWTKYQVHSQLCDFCRMSCLAVSQRYSWRCCRGLTEVTACSEDCRHRPGASCSAAVMCSSLGWPGVCLGRCMIHPTAECCRSMDCSNPSSLQPPPSRAQPCHACDVRPGDQAPVWHLPGVTDPQLTQEWQPLPADWLARLAWLAAAQNLSHFANPWPVSALRSALSDKDWAQMWDGGEEPEGVQPGRGGDRREHQAQTKQLPVRQN